MSDAEKAHNGIEIDSSRAAGKPPPVGEIAADVEMRKKECILKYVADAPLMPRQVDAAFRIDEDRAVDPDGPKRAVMPAPALSAMSRVRPPRDRKKLASIM